MLALWGAVLAVLGVGAAMAGDWRVAIDGMQARWRVHGEELVIELAADTTGWMVVGFNDRDHIVGADLVLVRVVGGKAELHDHHVVAAGDHRPDPTPSAGRRILDHAQSSGQTRARLALPLASSDPHDHRLTGPGERWMILAWSVSPDLDHHSRVRRHIRLRGLQPAE